MGSNMVNTIYNEKIEDTLLLYAKSLNLLLIDKWVKMPFWHFEFSKNEIKIIIDGDRAFDISIVINGNIFYLYQYDRTVIKKNLTNTENIIYQMEVLRKFLE